MQTKISSRHLRISMTACFALLSVFAFMTLVPTAAAQSDSNSAPTTVFVNPTLGGIILGYDIDQNGTEGVLSEYVDVQGGTVNIATETFDQTTGQITKVIAQQQNTHNNFVTQGVFSKTGLIEFDKSKGIFVDQRLYGTINPLSAHKLTGRWTPPLTKNQLILGIADTQGVTTSTALLASQNFNSMVIATDVVANTFGTPILLSDQVFGFNDSPVMAINATTNQVVVASSHGGILELPSLAIVDLATGTVSQFTGVGFGFVNGIAIDSTKNMAFTTTEVDFSVEFYDLATQTGFKVPMRNAVSQAQRGQYVAFDPINKLVLVGQEFSSVAPSGSSIQIFDEQGNFLKAVNGLNLPASAARIAINPSKRTGYVLVTPSLNQLQQFTY